MQKLATSPLFNVSLIAIFWALQIFVAKLSFRAGAEVFTFSLQTLIVIAALLSIYVLLFKLDALKKISQKTMFFLLGIGALGAGIGGTFSNAGIQLTTAINAGFLFQFDIAFTIILAWSLIKEKLDLPKIFMLLSILIGAYLLTTKGQLIIPQIGDSFILLASFCFSLATVLTRKAFKQATIDPDIASFLRIVAGLIFLSAVILCAPFYPKVLQQTVAVRLFDFHLTFYVFLNAFLCLGTIIFINRTLSIASASYTAMIAAVTPILVAILGIVFLHESLTTIQLLGAFFILMASSVAYFLKVDKH